MSPVFKTFEKIHWCLEMIRQLYNDGYTGNIQINFLNGKIVNINKTQSFKAPIE
jgi:hypothetical protein